LSADREPKGVLNYFIPIVYDSIRAQMNIEVTIDTLLTYKQNFTPISERQNYKERYKGAA